MDKGSKERSPPHNLGRNWVNTYAVRITMLIADIEDDIMDPVMQCTTLPSHSGFSQKKLVSFVTEIHTTSIDFLTPKHPSDTYVLTMKMEILLEPASNKLLVERIVTILFTLTVFVCFETLPVMRTSKHGKSRYIYVRRPYALSWKPCQGDSLNLPDHREKNDQNHILHNDNAFIANCYLLGNTSKDGDGDASFQLESDSLPHAHAQTTKTYYKHQDSRIMKAQELKTKTSAQTLIYKIFLQRYQVYQGRLLASFQDDAKYEHVGQDTRSQGGKDDQDGRIKI
ncbi:hypothetical protein Tco_0686193 [Tanacetum coccineum]